MREIQTAIVTGPTGAIGSALCNTLRTNNITVYAIVHPGSSRISHLTAMDGVHLVSCDASNYSTLPKLLPGLSADAFFHLAWAKTIGQGRNDMSAQIDNIRHTIDAVHAAKFLNCNIFIGAGSQAEYGRVDHSLTSNTPCFPDNGYGMAKLCAGQMSRIECQKLGLQHIWSRILSVYGPHDSPNSMISMVIRTLLRGNKPALTAGYQLWDFLYADDAAQALYHLALSGKHGQIYPLGGGQARPLREYIELIRDIISPNSPLGFGDIAYRPEQIMYLEADLGALISDTGYAPDTDFEDGIRKTIEWMKKNE